MKNTFLFFLLFSISIPLSSLIAQEVAHEIYLPTELYDSSQNSFFIYLDNDKFIPRRLDEDRDYTNGIAFSYNALQVSQNPLHRFNRFLLGRSWAFFHPNRNRNELKDLAAGLTLGSLAYTPRDIAERQIIFEDRPYASVHFLEFRTRLLDPNNNRLHSLGISYGVLASPIAEFVQRVVHTIGTIRPVPEGWHNQISHPWEPTLLINYQRDQIWQSPNRGSFYSDLRESIAFDLGFRILVSYALRGRLGRTLGSQRQGDLFFYFKLRPYFLAYDASLQGQFRPSVHTLDATQIRNFRMEAATGLSFNWQFPRGKLMAAYGFYAQTPEAIYPNHERFHFWARFYLGWGF